MISTEAKYNIIGQIKNFWDSTETLPTGKPLEKLISDGLVGFYPYVKELGSASTIVDVGKDKDAYDVKGIGCISYSYNEPKEKYTINNYYVNQSEYNIWVKIPKKVSTQVRRPNVDLENYNGEPETILITQIAEYKNFANETYIRDGFDNLYSILVLYGKNDFYKTLSISISPFTISEPDTYDYSYNREGKPNGYIAKKDEHTVFSLSSFNKGSSNFFKTFEVNNPITYTWKIVKNDIPKYSLDYLIENGLINENN